MAGRGLSDYGDPAGMFFLPDGEGWFWQTGRGSAYATLDGGARWHRIPLGPPDTEFISSIWVTPTHVGYRLVQNIPRRVIELQTSENSRTHWHDVDHWPIPNLDS